MTGATRTLSFWVGDVWIRKNTVRRVKDWEIIADNLSKAGWSLGWGWVSALDDYGRTVWIVDTHRQGNTVRRACR